MAIVDAVLVDVRSFADSGKYSEPVLVPTYMVRDHVQYYGKYQDVNGNISESLTSVIFSTPNLIASSLTNGQTPFIKAELVVELSLVKFHALMIAK